MPVLVDGPHPIDILFDQGPVFGWKRPVPQGFLDFPKCAVQIFFVDCLARAPRLRREQQSLLTAVQRLRLLFVQAGVRDGCRHIVAEPEDGLPSLLRAGRKGNQQEGHGEQDERGNVHSP